MTRKVFFSFHHLPDAWRTSQIRNAGILDGNRPVSDNDWESIKGGGDQAIRNWIAEQQADKSCVVVLIGTETASRKWVRYEIERGWSAGKGVVGVYIHALKDEDKQQSSKGRNPFTGFTACNGTKILSDVVPAYLPESTDSKRAYEIILANLADWVEAAIEIRRNFSC